MKEKSPEEKLLDAACRAARVLQGILYDDWIPNYEDLKTLDDAIRAYSETVDSGEK